MKKVCIVASYAPSLINFRGDLIAALIEQGCEVSCLAPDVDKDTQNKIQQLGATVTQMPLQRTGLNPLKDLQVIWFMYRHFRRFRPDVTMAYTIKPVIYGGIAAYFARVPHKVSLVTGLGFTFSDEQSGESSVLQKAIKKLYRFGLRCANKVVFQNPDDRKLLVEQGLVAEEKTDLVNGSGVNLKHFARAELPSDKTLKFLMIGRLNREKGVREYVEAAKQLKQDFNHVEFHLAGWLDSNPDSVSEQELNQWIADKVVVYHGHASDVRPLLMDCHIYVLPSYREGTPRTVLEAMATGRAVITTDAPGCRETVNDGENGYLVPVEDSQTLAEKMRSFVTTPATIDSMGEASYRLVEEKFEVGKVNQTMLTYMGILREETHG